MRALPIILVVFVSALTAFAAFAEELPGDSGGVFPGPIGREGSGTSWLPDSSPMHAYHFAAGRWSVMTHWNAFLRYTSQNAANGDKRGGEKFDAPNWFMTSARGPAGGSGELMLRVMLSLDRLTEGGSGYPLLLQSGESWKGRRLIDRQHPHDFPGELSASFALRVSKNAGLSVYFGLPGEPALGPPTYLHRPSSRNNPDAPLGHHWQDSTHIVFGVATAGFSYKGMKIEGSAFNGKEPDENRWDIDRPRFDSLSVRLSANPAADWAFQISHGYLKTPEALEPGVNQHRTTASALWTRPMGEGKSLAAALVWGRLKPSVSRAQDAMLLEADYEAGRYSFFGRAELVEKTGEEIGIEALGRDVLRVGALSVGAAGKLLERRMFVVSLGAMGTVNFIGDELKEFYGEVPFSAQVFLRLGPNAMKMAHMGGHAM